MVVFYGKIIYFYRFLWAIYTMAMLVTSELHGAKLLNKDPWPAAKQWRDAKACGCRLAEGPRGPGNGISAAVSPELKIHGINRWHSESQQLTLGISQGLSARKERKGSS